MKRWARTALGMLVGTLAVPLAVAPAQAWREGSWSPKFYPDTPPRVVDHGRHWDGGGASGRHRGHGGHVRHHQGATGQPQWVWVPAAWRWNGYSWVWVPGHWGAAW